MAPSLVHASGIAMESAVPVDRKELHPADLALLSGQPAVGAEEAQGSTAEIIHWADREREREREHMRDMRDMRERHERET